jgi:hypothetical protein
MERTDIFSPGFRSTTEFSGISIQTGFGSTCPVKKSTGSISTIPVKLFFTVFGIFGPDFKKCRQMIGRIGPVVTETVGDKSNLFVFCIDQILYTSCPVFAPHGIQNSPGFSIIIDSRIVSPAVGSKEQVRYKIQFSVRGRSLSIMFS